MSVNYYRKTVKRVLPSREAKHGSCCIAGAERTANNLGIGGTYAIKTKSRQCQRSRDPDTRIGHLALVHLASSVPGAQHTQGKFTS